MNPSEFKRILELGLGRAIVFLQTHDSSPYHDAILAACLHDTRYDGQVESRRSQYLFDVIQLTNNLAFFRDPILAALENTTDPESYTTSQLSGLAAHFAQNGDQRARQIIYDQFVTHLGSEEFNEIRRAYDVFLVDDLNGLLFVAERYGEKLLSDNDWQPIPWFDDPEDQADDDERAQWAAVTQAAATNPRIAAFVGYEREYHIRGQSRRRSNKAKQIPYDQFKKVLIDSKTQTRSGFTIRRWALVASDDDITRAATDLVSLDPQTDQDVLIRYLWLFDKRPFPLDPQKLIDLVRSAPGALEHDENDWLLPKYQVVLRAIYALKNISHPAVRDLALQLIDEGHWLRWAVDLLALNWQTDDWTFIANLAAREMDRDTYHGFGLGVMHILDARLLPDAASALLTLYERDPCSECRDHIVHSLQKIDHVPDWMIEECKYDANLYLREWASEKFPFSIS
ncbi:MAG: hypothetical protein JXA10_19710 [Anaerolineae bacterium]|nr:hypothetical protein [Anaerolineae bacterium]